MKKDKGVALVSPSSICQDQFAAAATAAAAYNAGEEEAESTAASNANERVNLSAPAAVRFSTRNASSKYDFVKVKVWLGDNADHYYVLSRFLLSRMLTVTKVVGGEYYITLKIPNHVAIKIALELKKLLIDNSLLDVSQYDLEANLFKLMQRRGYGEEYINRYKMMTRFHHQRVPLVILVCGTACVGKSTIATQLAQRLNLPNVLQTDMVYELLRTATDAPLTSSPVWAREFSSSEELITEFCRECRIVRKGLAGDLKKAMKDGKPIIIEGIHLDPSIYLMDEESKLPSSASTKTQGPISLCSNNPNVTQTESESNVHCDGHDENSCSGPGIVDPKEGILADEMNKISDGVKSLDFREIDPRNNGETIKNTEASKSPRVKKEKSGIEPIIVPIVLKMAEFDHKALLEEWISTRTFSNRYAIQEKDMLISNLKIIQNYLCSFDSQGLTVVNISATTFPQTLDWLHNYLLQCIEEGITSSSNQGGGQPVKSN